MKTSRPSTGPLLQVGAQGKLDSQEDRTRGRRRMEGRSGPVGVRIRKDLFRPTKFYGHTPEGSDYDERELPSLGHAWATKEG